MKFFTAAATLACAMMLVSCGPQASNDDQDKEVQERIDADKQAQKARELQEQEAALDERERLLNEREKQLAASPTPTPQPQPITVAAAVPPRQAPIALAPIAQQPSFSPDATFQTFYDGLAPYGSWIQLAPYGYVWQPVATVQNPAWRPYTLGHWVFTDDGWTWMSDEHFGWIVYHYGRWLRTRSLNWVWVPGDQWAPAWVSWRYGNDYVGWAPLPPEARFDGATGIQQWADQQYNLGASDYTFVPAADFGDGDMAGVAVAPDQDGGIYDASTNITNIYYDSGAYAIVCQGPIYDFMRSKSRVPLSPRLRLRRIDYRADGKNGQEVSGGTLSFTAPSIVNGRTAPRPRTFISENDAVSRANNAAGTAFRAPQAAGGTQAPPRMAPPVPVEPPAAVLPASPDAGAQKAHDLQIIQQRQADEEERQRREAARQAAEQDAEQKRAERAAAEESARAAREQQQQQTARDQAARLAQPGSVTAGTPPVGQGRPQQ